MPFCLQAYEEVLEAYTKAIRAKTEALEGVADGKPKADMVIARNTAPDTAVAELLTLLNEREGAILSGAQLMVRVDKVYR